MFLEKRNCNEKEELKGKYKKRDDEQVWLMAMRAGRGGGKLGVRRRSSSPPRVRL